MHAAAARPQQGFAAVGGLSVNLVGGALKVSGYQIRPLGCNMQLRFDPASKRPLAGMAVAVSQADITPRLPRLSS